MIIDLFCFFFFKQKTAYEMRISDWSSDVCSSDLFAANPKTLDWYLGWQADSMVHALLEKKDLDSEMTVVRNEMERDQNSPVQVLAQTMRSAAYQWHNYGHSTMGARSDIENVNVAQLRAFYTRYYQPDNAEIGRAHV